MFLGYYTSICTSKNQLTFPSKFKEEIGEELLLTAWFENTLILLPAKKGEEIIHTLLRDNSALLPEARDLERFFFGNAKIIRLDRKNRFVVPKVLTEYAKIGKRAVFLGVSERIELWDEDMYKNYSKLKEIQIRETALYHYNRIKK